MKYFHIIRTGFIHASTGESPGPQPSIYSSCFFNILLSLLITFYTHNGQEFPRRLLAHYLTQRHQETDSSQILLLTDSILKSLSLLMIIFYLRFLLDKESQVEDEEKVMFMKTQVIIRFIPQPHFIPVEFQIQVKRGKFGCFILIILLAT